MENTETARPLHQELGDIKRETEKLMSQAVSGDRDALDQVLALSRRREKLLMGTRKMEDFVRPKRREAPAGAAFMLIALGFVLGLAAALMIQLVT
jgi:hypothetical protein